MKLLLTGASGFVGRHFIEELDKLGFHYHCLNREKFNCDSYLPENNVVVHLSGLAHVSSDDVSQSKQEFFQANCNFACEVAKAAVKAGMKRFVYVSSLGVYGKNSSESTISETEIKKPKEIYGQSKLAGEHALEKLSDDLNFELVIIRPALVYGGDAPGNISSLMELIRKLPLIPLGEKGNQRSFLSVDNLIDLLLVVLDHPKAVGKIYNVADLESISTYELISFLALGMGRKPMLLSLPRSLMKPILKGIGKGKLYEQLFESLVVDTSLARYELSWQPKVKIRDGLINAGRYFAVKKSD